MLCFLVISFYFYGANVNVNAIVHSVQERKRKHISKLRIAILASAWSV